MGNIHSTPSHANISCEKFKILLHPTFPLTINIVESNQGFAPCTVISPVAIPGHEPTVINIGHIDELHYVSTIPYNQQMVEINVSCTSQFAQATGNETVVNTLSKEEERARMDKKEESK